MKRKLFIAVLVLVIAFPITIASPAEAAGTDFTDVSKSHSAYSEIMSLKTKGFINGYPNGTFNPTAPITRMHVSALFARSLDLPSIRPGNEFNDVPKNHPYYNEIQKVYRAGIFDGKDESNFNPNAILTRAQMAKILHLAFDFETHTENIFSDVPSNHWAKDHIATLYAHNVTTGNAGKFNPNGYVSRAHYAVFLDRALKSSDEVYTQRVNKIQKNWNVLKPSYTSPIMAEEASTSPPYQLGKVHHTELAEALNLTNFVRFLSYLPSNIKLNAAFNEEAQATSLVNAANQSMSHTPLQPVAMSKAFV